MLTSPVGSWIEYAVHNSRLKTRLMPCDDDSFQQTYTPDILL